MRWPCSPENAASFRRAEKEKEREEKVGKSNRLSNQNKGGLAEANISGIRQQSITMQTHNGEAGEDRREGERG